MASFVFSTTTKGPIAEAKERVVAALSTEGFGVLTEIDVSATLKAKLDVEMPGYLILGACNPPLAHQAISAVPSIGALLPCNVVLRADDGDQITVDFMDPQSVLTLVDVDGIEAIAAEVKSRLERVRVAIDG